jgi:chromosome segregation ATPase
LQESFKKINSIQEENLLLQTKMTELEVEIETSKTKHWEIIDWYEDELNITSNELKRMKDFYEQEIDKRNERMEKQLKKSEKQKLLQKQLEGFINTLTEEINRPWKTPMNTKEEAENKNDFKIKHLQKELEKEIKNLDTLKKDMQAKITELAFLQMSGEVNKFQDHINMLVHQISGYGEDIAKVSQKVNQLNNEIEHNK